MNVILKSSCMVKPAVQTFSGSVSLTAFDQICEITHSSIVYFYRPPKHWLTPPDTIIKTLKNSLSQALFHFYPLAGRLRWIGGGRLELNCNAMGAEFIEAESDAKLDQLEDISPSLMFMSLIPPIDYALTPFEQLPLLLIQLTEFSCGAICLGFAISHAVVDGLSFSYFLNEWSKMARGELIASEPFLNRKALINIERCTALNDECTFGYPGPSLPAWSQIELKKETTLSNLKLTKDQVDTLKKKANEGCTHRPYTRYEAITAHIWRTACKARGHKSEQPTGLALCVDIRNRIEPPLPINYFGNATVDVIAIGLSGDLVSKPLGYSASKIRETIEKVTNNFVHSVLDFYNNHKDLSQFQDLHALMNDQGPFYGNPNLLIISWLNLPPPVLDFGWGREVYMCPVALDSDGESIIFPSSDGDGSVFLSLRLQVAHIEAFKKFFYQDINRKLQSKV